MKYSEKKLWLIDLDGTLYKPGLVKWAMAAELLLFGWTALPVIRAFRKAHEQLRADSIANVHLCFEPSPFEEQLRRACANSHYAEAHVKRVVLNWMFERPGKWLKLSRRSWLIKEIEAFQKGGGKTALVSDYPARIKLKAMGIEHLFDLVVANGETPNIRRLKPAPDGINAAMQYFKFDKSQTLMIGDRLDADGAAAEAAGIAFRHI